MPSEFKKTCHIIGAGRVGKTLALLLSQQHTWRLSHIVSSSLSPSAVSAEVCRSVAQLPPADAVLLAVPDDAIETVALALADSPHFRAGTLAVHLSGAKTVAALAAVTERGGLAGSLHPVFAFADPVSAAANLAGSLCALETQDQRALALLTELAHILGLQPFTVLSEYKSRYHAALSAASNFSITLAGFARDLLSTIALPDDLAQRLVYRLMKQSIENLAALSPEQALTGPIVRGDTATVAAHLSAMTAEEQAFYRVLAQATAELAAGRLKMSEANCCEAKIQSVQAMRAVLRQQTE
ncbi:Rossmann-like and DUF2520 domain-containing protein [Neisseria lisongii]|uniref:DUF2520 domain-containing protein n=1 Tax=Neisseria lisongii TaxID=2912188 RepID=A0AAW5AJ70_9NEIS|nr:Rossmann-like and DUF2520 domain-containing protein [Neisseria lisongii]MCF7529927.1 DUF2520 domain-containing protein [Neisseria lisongii]